MQVDLIRPPSRTALRSLRFSMPLLWTMVAGSALAAEAPPADGWVTWASNREAGRHEIYVMKAGDLAPTRVTTEGGIYPLWSPDGRWIAYNHTADSTTHVVRWNGTEDHEVCKGVPVFWMHDNSGVVCAVLSTEWIGWEGMSRSDRYLLANPELGTTTDLWKRSDFKHLVDEPGPQGQRHFMPGGMTHDGRYVVGWVFGLFQSGYTADNGRFTAEHASVALDLTDKTKLYFLGPGCTTSTPPLGNLLYHVSREGPTSPDVYSLDMNDLMERTSYTKVVGRPDSEWGHDYFPRVSTDNQWLTYAASTNCHAWYDCDYELFLYKLGAADSTTSLRLTTNPANDNYPHMYVGPAWTPEPDRARIALGPDRAVFRVAPDAPAAPKKVTVWSAGGKPLAPIETSVAYHSGADWLSVTTTAGDSSSELVLEVRPGRLAPKDYRATVVIRAANAANSPRALDVHLALAGHADGGAEVDAGVDAGGPDAGADAAAAEPAAPAEGSEVSRTSGGGCGCRLGPSSPGGNPLALGLLALALARAARSRRR
jgi:MYXO-CTERM domain-containing protein